MDNMTAGRTIAQLTSKDHLAIEQQNLKQPIL